MTVRARGQPFASMYASVSSRSAWPSRGSQALTTTLYGRPRGSMTLVTVRAVASNARAFGRRGAESVIHNSGEVHGDGGLADAALLVSDDVDLRAEVLQVGDARQVVVGLVEIEGQSLADAVGPPDGGSLGVGAEDKHAGLHRCSRLLPVVSGTSGTQHHRRRER